MTQEDFVMIYTIIKCLLKKNILTIDDILEYLPPEYQKPIQKEKMKNYISDHFLK